VPSQTPTKPTILFYGTEQFGAAMLEALIASARFTIIGAVTQPDRPVGRKNELHASPVKQLAQHHGIPIFQPESLKNIDIRDQIISTTGPDHQAPNFQSPISNLPTSDLQIVCQYGLIIPKRIVEATLFGTINVHTSLLPKYRGASPIQTAIMNGETETGITIMQMDEKMDHGAILAQEKIAIAPDDTTPTLSQKMIPVAQKLLVETTIGWLEKTVQPIEQDHAAATFCRQFEKGDGVVDFSLSAAEIYNRFRAFTPWPGTFAYWNGTRIKFLAMRIGTTDTIVPPGQCLVSGKSIYVGTATTALEILELQREGGKALTAEAFLAGVRDFDGARLQGKEKEGVATPSQS
jgi:methionyl-tRNA formyltransferase